MLLARRAFCSTVLLTCANGVEHDPTEAFADVRLPAPRGMLTAHVVGLTLISGAMEMIGPARSRHIKHSPKSNTNLTLILHYLLPLGNRPCYNGSMQERPFTYVQLRLPNELHARATEIAERHHRTLHGEIVTALEAWIAKASEHQPQQPS